ncbi:MAG: hypothetical protein J3Q66DRAFT_384802 [Benniella sp.]|nr:MAG: hypothetical protein J3Q66DRAFT_384802 [Benniella sp.]
MQQQIAELRQQIAEQQQQIAMLQQEQCSEQRAKQTDLVGQSSQISEYQTQQRCQQQLMDSTREQDTIYRHSLIHYRIQEHLRVPLGDLLVPRLFIVLPKNASLSDGQGDSSALTFRLHFLCEGITYSPVKDTKDTESTKGTCDIHMTNHPGYNIKDPKEFFGKYGSYTLTTMYMIKYGATAPGFVVPPLAYSKLVARIEEDQGYLASIKKDIGRLMDITISHLEDTPSIDRDCSATSHWSLTLADQTELKSYLDNVEDEHFPGHLRRLASQERHCMWMCREHQHEWIIQHLKDVVNTAGGTYSEDSEKIMINCDTVEERLYDAMIKFCKAQTADDPSLSANIGQLSLTASTSQAGQEISVTINLLSDLTMDGVKFIQQCNITKLTIKRTPEDTDEDRLVDILNQCHELKELHIRCNGERSYAIIHLVISTRETTLQEGRTSALHTFKVTDERWDPFDWYRGYDGYDHLVTTVTFTKDTAVFDMDTQLKMQCLQPVVEGSPISHFMRHYGWSISSLATSMQITDHLATLLDNATEKRGSRLTHLILSPPSLTTLGMDAMDRVIKRSQSLEFLWIWCIGLDEASRPEKALLLFGRYGEKLNRLTLNSHSMGLWLLPFTQALPTANSFPRLKEIHVECALKSQVPPEFVQWLLAAVPVLPSGSSEGFITEASQKTSTILARLRTFRLYNVTLQPQDWETLIMAIDLSVLEELHLTLTNFSLGQLDLLLECVAAADAKSVSLKVLGLLATELLVNADGPALQARILEAVPQLSIQGL